LELGSSAQRWWLWQWVFFGLWQWVFFGAWQCCAAAGVGGYGSGSSLVLGSGVQHQLSVAMAAGLLWSLAVVRSSGCWWLFAK